MRARWCVFALLMLAGCQRSDPAPEAANPSTAPDVPVATTGRSSGPVSVDFQNVHFRLGPGIVLEVRHLQGALIALRPGLPPVFDDVASYSLRIDAGEVAMTPASLTALLNTRVFNYEGAPITDVEVSISGRLTRIRIEGDRIVETFGSSPPAHATGGGNYMHYRGNLLRFGRLTMNDTDMRLIDADPSDPFDFSPREYVKHLVAGYSKNTADGRLRVYMPDYDQASRADLRPASPEAQKDRAAR